MTSYFLWIGSTNFEHKGVGELWRTFKVGKEECKNFEYLGIKMKQRFQCVASDYNEYISNIKPIERNLSSDDSIDTE